MIFGAKENEESIRIGAACLKETTGENLLGILPLIDPYLSNYMSKLFVRKPAKNFMLLPGYPVTWAQKNCSN